MGQTHRDKIIVQEADFDVAAEYQRLAGDATIGAVVMFVGRVRDINPQPDLVSLHLEHYPAMTERALHKIVAQAHERWPLDAVTIIHRVGSMGPAEQIVLVLTASAHRVAAYDANIYIMDYLKNDAPFWKKEVTLHQATWVEAKDSDQAAQLRWER
ncbi:molybdopterin synthase catalytic subunit MoaE [Chitinibacter bivalviorum]|uniref:Molybdopterin synthase catalytic subunit n=1 Tax=Chitinibacter bivalviorum TaxID=2739434 RepID=A0A7H9BKF4_9NEIS|nr:molybdopterin synthase catalytic subunit MoaE [Chitinibacter bivalviorum]QLG88852.1 molybdopterin synthase catalytic subunit MoaE [Chitinibacter bivalviorum]